MHNVISKLWAINKNEDTTHSQLITSWPKSSIRTKIVATNPHIFNWTQGSHLGNWKCTVDNLGHLIHWSVNSCSLCDGRGWGREWQDKERGECKVTYVVCSHTFWSVWDLWCHRDKLCSSKMLWRGESIEMDTFLNSLWSNHILLWPTNVNIMAIPERIRHIKTSFSMILWNE